MNPDDEVCLCFRVSLRKLDAFMRRTRPTVPSQLSDCLGAGTGCHWCVPFLTRLHEQWRRGDAVDLPVSPADYAARRARYRSTGLRDPSSNQSGNPSSDPPPG